MWGSSPHSLPALLTDMGSSTSPGHLNSLGPERELVHEDNSLLWLVVGAGLSEVPFLIQDSVFDMTF